MPNISGWFKAEGYPIGADGALSIEQNSTWLYGTYSSTGHKVTLDASRSNPIYGNSETVQPASMTAFMLIKY